MTHLPHARSLLLVVAALGLSSCGNDDTNMPAAAAATPAPSPAPSPTPGPTPSPTPTPTPSPAPSPTPTPPPTGGQDDFILLEDIRYGQGATQAGAIDLLLDIYQPEAGCTAPRPTIFYVHGGGFILGDKQDSIVEALVPLIMAEGFNFVSINYRLAGDNPVLSPRFQTVAQSYVDDGIADPDSPVFDAIFASFEDGTAALNWMEDNADRYCIDIDRIGYWGSSAGTFVTVQIAYSLNQFGIERPEPRFVNAWWGELLRIEDLEAGEAPFLILHGDQDPLVNYQVSVNLANRAETVAVPFAFYTLVGAGHGFDVDNQAQTAAGIEASVRFAAQHLTDVTPTYGRFDVR